MKTPLFNTLIKPEEYTRHNNMADGEKPKTKLVHRHSIPHDNAVNDAIRPKNLSPEPEKVIPQKKVSTALISTLAGAVAGMMEVAFTWPTEFLKTQLQLQMKQGEKPKNPMVTIFKNTIKNDGILGLYRGMAPVLLMGLPKSGVRFGCYEAITNVMTDGKGKAAMKPWQNFLAGLGAGAMEAILVVTPQETLKVKLIRYNAGFFRGTTMLIRDEGLRGIYQGLIPTIGKQATDQGFRFVTYMKMKEHFMGTHPERPLSTPEAAFSGMVAGFVSVLGNNPIDVVKTRMQGAKPGEFSNTWSCVSEVWNSGGVKGFYKGALPRLMRTLPGQALLFSSYETICSVVEKFLSS